MKEYFHHLQRLLAKIWLRINLQLTIIGVTGSYGKTAAVRAISEVLSAKYSVNRTDLNLDTIYNLPLTILRTKIWDEVLVLEYGVDHQGEMDFHLSLVKPKIAVLTGITPVHADEEHLGSLENVIAEKEKLIKALGTEGLAVFNFDDENVRKIGERFKGRKVFYGLKKGAQVRAQKVKLKLEGTEFELQDGREKFFVKTPLLGYPAVYCSLVAYVLGKELGVEKEKIFGKIATLKPLEGRFSIENGPLGALLVNDAKRANPASTIAGLRSLAEFPGRKVVVLGEMGELGEYSERMHRLVGKEIAKLKLDLLVGVGPLTKLAIEEAQKNGLKKNQVFWAEDVKGAAEILKKILKKGDLLYLKASLLRHLERIILLLIGEKVNCRRIVCHHYGLCPTCDYLKEPVK